ncbi:MAG: YbdD/YjiX family protein [Rhodospirillales bacterium]
MLKAIAASARGQQDVRGHLIRFRQWLSMLVKGSRQVCGIPDYQAYLAHQRRHHPEQPLLSYEAFFRERIDARYGGRNGKIRCC